MVQRSVRHWFTVKAAAIAVLGAGLLIVPRGVDGWTRLEAATDPVALTDLGLKDDFSATRLRAELTAALDADDVDLAASFLKLAEQQRTPVPNDLRVRYKAATTTLAAARRGAKDFYGGAVSGEASSGAGFAGVIASDLSGIGDIRDLAREGGKVARGEEPDRLVLGLAAVGLVVTGVTIATLATATPARAGASVLKAAAKSGRLSRPLADGLLRMTQRAVDVQALGSAAAAAARLDLTGARVAARSAVRPAAFARLRGVAEDTALIGRRAGVQGAQEAMTLARDPAELTKIARVAEARGVGTRAVLKVLGRGAIAAGAGALTLASWTMATAGWLWFAFLVAVSLSVRCLRLAWWTCARGVDGARAAWRWRARRRLALQQRAMAPRFMPPQAT